MSQTINTMETLNIIQGKQVVNNYPYGSLKCSMSFDIEFKPSKGYRLVMQSTNPKTGILNAPKYSTYNHFSCLIKEEGTNHFKSFGMNLYGYTDVNKFIEFLRANTTIEFTPEENQYLWTIVISCIRGNMQYTSLKDKGNTQPFLIATCFQPMVKAYGQNLSIYELLNMPYDITAINDLKV